MRSFFQTCTVTFWGWMFTEFEGANCWCFFFFFFQIRARLLFLVWMYIWASNQRRDTKALYDCVFRYTWLKPPLVTLSELACVCLLPGLTLQCRRPAGLPAITNVDVSHVLTVKTRGNWPIPGRIDEGMQSYRTCPKNWAALFDWKGLFLFFFLFLKVFVLIFLY